MNLILFEPAEIAVPLSRSDPRAAHLLEVLRRREGDEFDAGLIDGPRGKGRLLTISPAALTLGFTWGAEPPPLAPLTLIVGLPRPQTARDILRDATAVGVGAMHFVATEKGDPNYGHSTLWNRDEWRRHVRLGAEQAFCTRLPAITHGRQLADVIDSLAAYSQPNEIRLALDNYESPRALSRVPIEIPRIALAFGPERGWSASERELLRSRAFEFVHLGARVLRAETAVVAAVTLVRAKLGLM